MMQTAPLLSGATDEYVCQTVKEPLNSGINFLFSGKSCCLLYYQQLFRMEILPGCEKIRHINRETKTFRTYQPICDFCTCAPSRKPNWNNQMYLICEWREWPTGNDSAINNMFNEAICPWRHKNSKLFFNWLCSFGWMCSAADFLEVRKS